MSTQTTVTYVEDNSVREVFADGHSFAVFDGGNVRVELTVGRPGSSNEEVKKHPVARVVLPLPAVTDLIGRLTGLLKDLEGRGVIRRSAEPGKGN